MTSNFCIFVFSVILALGVSSVCFGQAIRVTSSEIRANDPSVSPDGEWVVFRSPGSGLARVRTDGSEYTQLTQMTRTLEPDWSRHNDSLIIFRHNDSTLGQILLMVNAFTFDTSFVFGGRFDDGPVWAPDGSAIAMQNASPSGIRIITYPDTTVVDVVCTTPDGRLCHGENPTWSPDAEWIAFDEGLEILKVQKTGGLSEVVVEGLGNASFPAWSPDGNWVAFTLDSAFVPIPQAPYSFPIVHIWITDSRGTSYGVYKITGGLVADYRPAWSPGSDTIFFVRTGLDTLQSGMWKVPILSAINSMVCGDVNNDSSPSNILDLTYLIDFIFRGGRPALFPENADLNGDGDGGNILDLTFLVDYIFRGGPAPTCGL